MPGLLSSAQEHREWRASLQVIRRLVELLIRVQLVDCTNDCTSRSVIPGQSRQVVVRRMHRIALEIHLSPALLIRWSRVRAPPGSPIQLALPLSLTDLRFFVVTLWRDYRHRCDHKVLRRTAQPRSTPRNYQIVPQVPGRRTQAEEAGCREVLPHPSRVRAPARSRPHRTIPSASHV